MLPAWLAILQKICGIVLNLSSECRMCMLTVIIYKFLAFHKKSLIILLVSNVDC